MSTKFLHELLDFKDLIEITATAESIKDRALFEKEYTRSESLYFRGRPTLNEILERIGKELNRL